MCRSCFINLFGEPYSAAKPFEFGQIKSNQLLYIDEYTPLTVPFSDGIKWELLDQRSASSPSIPLFPIGL